jgi:hypothetical protein
MLLLYNILVVVYTVSLYSYILVLVLACYILVSSSILTTPAGQLVLRSDGIYTGGMGYHTIGIHYVLFYW